MAKKTKSQPPVRPAHPMEIKGVVLCAFALVLGLSLASFSLHGNNSTNWIGIVGGFIGWGMTALFGLASYLIPLYLVVIGIRWLTNWPLRSALLSMLYFTGMMISICMLLSLFEDRYAQSTATIRQVVYSHVESRHIRYHLGGAPFYYLYRDMPMFNLLYILNAPGVAVLFTTTLVTSLLLLTNLSVLHMFRQLASLIERIRAKSPDTSEKPTAPKIVGTERQPTVIPSAEFTPLSDFMRYVKLRIPNTQFSLPASLGGGDASSQTADMLAIQPEQNVKTRPWLSRKENNEPTPKQKKDAAIAAQKVFNGDFSGYTLPSLTLLTNAKKLDHSSLKKDLKRKAEVLEETLLSFGIEAKVGQINCGPTITSFEVQPSIGVKVQKIKALENDIALNMEAKSIRIIAPIPGKAVVGIEIPNAQAEEVGFKEMLAAYQQSGKQFRIPILLGKAVNGDYVMSDLTKMPHCIIAGATGSGKSVCINTIVMAILLTASPDDIKLVMVDPKKVELTPYSRLPHMLAPVITEPQGACAALNWLVKEMERRYEYLKQVGVRNIEAFNVRTIDKERETASGIEIPEKLPYLVGIIDELADLMMAASSDIETPIARIAQMARAVGIHLILATQRPSREVITGLIKANFPTRISFKVSSRVNSLIVLDDTGAETLLGNGDMLFLPPGTSHMVRAQGAYIRDEDINRIVDFICKQAPPRYLIESFDSMDHSAFGEDEDADESDALYSQAKEIVLGTGNASTTFLQRKLKIGYARAASLIDLLEQKGIVGAADGSKARKVLANRVGGKTPEFDLEEDLD